MNGIQAATIFGVKILDPRDDTYKASSNPALILLDACRRETGVLPNNLDFYRGLANWCDEKGFSYNGSPSSIVDILANIR